MTIIVLARLILFTCALILVLLAAFGFINRHYQIPGTGTFIILSLLSAVYVASFAVELSQTSIDGIWVATRFEYLGLAFIPAFWVSLVFMFSGRSRYLSPPLLVAMFTWSAGILILVWTNGVHHLYYRTITLTAVGSPAVFTPGDLYPLAAISFYTSLVLGFLCLRNLGGSAVQRRFQRVIIISASLACIVANSLYNLGIRPAGIDFSPFGLTLGVAIMAIGLFRNRHLSLVPIARERVIESMQDAVVVLDSVDRILDFNPAARQMFPLLGELSFGQICHEASSPCRELGDALRLNPADIGDFSLKSGDEEKSFQFHRSTIRDHRGQILGSTIVINDKTDYIRLLGQMTEMATHDFLTGLFNRRRFSELAEAEVRRCVRYRHHISLVMFDIDHFKHINDTHGHRTGDAVLKEISTRAAQAIRTMDVLARVGGEEFMVMLPDTDGDGGQQTAERIRDAIRSRPIQIGNLALSITASFGLSSLPDDGLLECWADDPPIQAMLDQLMTQADDAMYQAKRAGRDQVVRIGLC